MNYISYIFSICSNNAATFCEFFFFAFKFLKALTYLEITEHEVHGRAFNYFSNDYFLNCTNTIY